MAARRREHAEKGRAGLRLVLQVRRVHPGELVVLPPDPVGDLQHRLPGVPRVLLELLEPPAATTCSPCHGPRSTCAPEPDGELVTLDCVPLGVRCSMGIDPA